MDRQGNSIPSELRQCVGSFTTKACRWPVWEFQRSADIMEIRWNAPNCQDYLQSRQRSCKEILHISGSNRVKIPTLASTDTITIGGMVYEMTIKGFNYSGGYTNTLWTDEKDKSYAKLYASLAKVPEPSIIALFGIGLLGLGFASRRKGNG
jgi:hypothetical protein